MGWHFLHDTSKEELVNWLDRDLSPGETLLGSRVIGRCHWQLIRVCTGRVVIQLNLVEKQDGMWGYKSMTEDDRPYFYSCPIYFLNQASPPASEESANWRLEVVRAQQQARKTQVLSPGQIIEIGHEFYQVLDKHPTPRMGYRVVQMKRGGIVMRLPLKLAKRCSLLTKEEYVDRLGEQASKLIAPGLEVAA